MEWIAQRGTGWVFDIVGSYQAGLYPEHLPLNLIAFAELISVNEQRRTATWACAEQLLKDAAAPSPLSDARVILPGLSPHASYTTDEQLLDNAVARSIESNLPIAMHVAETREELSWLQYRDEPLGSFLSPHSDELHNSKSFREIEKIITMLSMARRTLLIHGNYLDSCRLAQIAEHRERFALVYCPRTHAAFGHPTHPISEAIRKGIAVFLGTDSLASNPDLDVWSEMQFVRREHPWIDGNVIWSMATSSPRRFMGLEPMDGGLVVGSPAVFAKLPVPENNCKSDDLCDLLLRSECTAERIEDSMLRD